MPPQRPNLVLTTDIPNVELDVPHRHRLDVEADGWDRRNGVGQLERVEDSCLSGSIETKHEDSYFPGAKQLVDEPGEARHGVAHLGECGCPCGLLGDLVIERLGVGMGGQRCLGERETVVAPLDNWRRVRWKGWISRLFGRKCRAVRI